MNIGVLTSDGIMYIIRTNKKLKDDKIEDFVYSKIAESPNNFNWQVLAESYDGFLNFRILEVE